MTSVSLLVPWRSDGGVRDRLWAWCSDRWRRTAPDVEIVEGRSSDGPFRVGEALNDAASRASGELFFNIAADMVPDVEALNAAVPYALEHGWAAPFVKTAFLTDTATAQLIAGDADPETELDSEGIVIVNCCNGPTVTHRDAWAEIGGCDNRFAGWGAEDLAFRIALATLIGDGPQLDATLLHLFHGEGIEQETSDGNRELFLRYEAANGNPDTMRELLATAAV